MKLPSLKNMSKNMGNYQILVIFFVALILFYFLVIKKRMNENSAEGFHGFHQKEKFVLKKDDDVYDNFYANIYDLIFNSPDVDYYQVEEVLRNIRDRGHKFYSLDVGSGIGNHVAILNDYGIQSVGVDKSHYMVNYARSKYPNLDFIVGDVQTSMLFPDETFNMITCFNYTIYEVPNKRQFIKNCFDWLAPGGYFVIHLVKDKFIPLYSDRGIDTWLPYPFGNRLKQKMSYKVELNMIGGDEKEKGILEEIFQDKETGKVRKNQKAFHLESEAEILRMAQNIGFISLGKVILNPRFFNDETVYILYKNN